MARETQEFSRNITPAVMELAKSFPIVAITGPRQSGKTTLAKELFANKAYFNLEDPSVRVIFENDPKGLLQQVKEHGAIFDEVQHFPDLLSYLQVEVDENPIKGHFVITGSYNFSLMQNVSQSLAGRVGLVELLPMSTQELLEAGKKLTPNEAILYGGLPRIFRDNLNPTLVYRNYVKTYIERDMRNIIQVKDLSQFQRFMQLCASRIGYTFSASAIGNELGLSHHTIQSWVSVLEASYVVFRLQPYFENIGKRVVKSPKLYFSDVGLATYLLGMDSIEQIDRDRLKGNLFENLVILDCYKQLLNQGKEPRLYFYRDQSQNEVDLIWQKGRDLVPIEIKYGQTFKLSFIKGLQFFKKLMSERVQEGCVIYTGETLGQKIQGFEIRNYQGVAEVMR